MLVSTDDFAGWLALHSNLALKGIVGIKAMSELAATMGYDDDVKYYQVSFRPCKENGHVTDYLTERLGCLH